MTMANSMGTKGKTVYGIRPQSFIAIGACQTLLINGIIVTHPSMKQKGSSLFVNIKILPVKINGLGKNTI